jgi:hypothetical protein
VTLKAKLSRGIDAEKIVLCVRELCGNCCGKSAAAAVTVSVVKSALLVFVLLTNVNAVYGGTFC